MNLQSRSNSIYWRLRQVRSLRWFAPLVVIAALVTVAHLLLGRSQESTVGGPLFDNAEMVFDLDPEATYPIDVHVVAAEYGISRYEVAVDAQDGRGYVVKDRVKLDCSKGCPKDAPKKKLVLDSSVVPSGELKVRVRAVGVERKTEFSRTRKVEKRLQIGIQEPRLGRPKPGSDPNDVNPYAVHGDRDFIGLRTRYFRIFVPWDRLEPSPDRFDWDADIGGGHVPPQLYRSTVKDQIQRAQRLGMKVMVTFQHTPCWALISEATSRNSDPCKKNEFGRRVDSNKASWPDPFRGTKSGKTMIDEYKEFVAAFIEQFSGPDVAPARRVKLYTAWNEPNNFGEAQPQICSQSHTDRERFPDFERIRCPSNEKPGDTVSDDYYMMLYNRIFDVIYDEDVPGMSGTRFDPSIKLLPGDTADFSFNATDDTKNVDEAEFTESVIEKMLAADQRRCPRGPWAKHSYKDIRDLSMLGVERVVNLLDGKDSDTGKPITGIDTNRCTKGLQIWITEAASLYGGREGTDDRTASCKLFTFLDRAAFSKIDRRRARMEGIAERVDVFIQYLYQTDPGYDSGVLSPEDADGNGRLDRRTTYKVLKDWSHYLQDGGVRPIRSDFGSRFAGCKQRKRAVTEHKIRLREPSIPSSL